MPTYEFYCVSCGPFERLRDHRESGEEMRCPECGLAARRIYSAPAFTAHTKADKEARRLDRGSEPRIGVRQSVGDPSPKPRRSGGRPWQISH